ncbi:MAG: dethiobiotin synthase [Holosporaceae bacterium]|jgi:dethiobiotin synthase|nr:dethiobiotin synthase [Holosporaceae bacterium]
MNIFVTGTDTDVGKTVVSSWLCVHTTAKYWKPIQTGDDSDKNTVKKLSPPTEIISEAYRLKAPLSPYDSAKSENIEINLELFDEITSREKSLCIIEGAGGVLVPIAENFFMADLIKRCGAKAIVVAKSKLGMINHTLMTVEILRARKIDVIGTVINGEIDSGIKDTLEKFSRVKIFGIIPHSENLYETLRNVKLSPEFLEMIS